MVGHPLAGLAAVVAVEHGGDGVHAQAVDVIVLQPEQGAADQEAAHLVAAEVVDQRVPILVEPFARVRVLVKGGAVELRQAVRVGREVGGHPVEDDAEVGLVAAVHEGGEALRRAEPGGGRELPERLVAPGAAERVLHDGHELQVREAHGGGVGDEPVRQVVPPGVAHLRVGRPRASVDFINGDGRVRALGGGAPGHPFGVRPGGFGAGRDDGGRRGWNFGCPGDGVGLERQGVPLRSGDFVFVDRTGGDSGDEQVPHACAGVKAHGAAAAVPGVEAADHGHAARIRRPYGEADAGHAVHLGRVRAKRAADVVVAALTEEVEIQLAQGGADAVRVFHVHREPARVAHAQTVGQEGGQAAQPEAFRPRARHVPERLTRCAVDELDRLRAGQDGPYLAEAANRVRTQDGERVAEPGLAERVHRVPVDAPGGRNGRRHVVHVCSPCGCPSSAGPCSRRWAMAWRPPSGMPSQVGRLAAS